jgi:hypothetical protein
MFFKTANLEKLLLLMLFLIIRVLPVVAFSSDEDGSIKPYIKNTWYWQYKGEPVVLIGGSDEDNLFQWTGSKLTGHLDLLVSVGGNYLRNTMSDRDAGNVYAFRRLDSGRYDLNQWNDEYWSRLTFFLEETHKRGIIVQLTLWDQFDLGTNEWRSHPWNPENNINQETGHWSNRSDFYTTVDNDDREGLYFQKLFIDKLLSVSMQYDHVLYNINNESGESPQWENYWAQYINQTAESNRRQVNVTTMQFNPSDAVRHVMTHRDIFSFVEISQNNQDSRGGRGQAHWDNIMYWRSKIATLPNGPMPMNNEKVYGAVDGVNYSAGTETEAMNRFWRNIFAGCASSRFHRPAEPDAWGSGLNLRAQRNLAAMNMLLNELDIFSCSPHNDLLSNRVPVASMMEAYVSANIGKQYAVYFPAGRYTIDLDPWVYVDRLQVRWLDIDELTWSQPRIIDLKWDGGIAEWGDRGRITLTTPGNKPYVVLLEVVE